MFLGPGSINLEGNQYKTAAQQPEDGKKASLHSMWQHLRAPLFPLSTSYVLARGGYF
jgi:hypothetical protein